MKKQPEPIEFAYLIALVTLASMAGLMLGALARALFL